MSVRANFADIYLRGMRDRSVWTKRWVGHGLPYGPPYGPPYDPPYGPPYGLPVVNFSKTRLSTAVNLCKQRAQSICHIFDSTLGGVSLKFSRQTRGRLESAKPECRVNKTFRQISYEIAIIIKQVSRISER